MVKFFSLIFTQIPDGRTSSTSPSNIHITITNRISTVDSVLLYEHQYISTIGKDT